LFEVAAALLGLLFGSFGTVVSHRVPLRKGIATGRSLCPNCERQIKAYENIPVLSWLVMRGRCPGCGTKISIRYPLAELATAGLFLLAAWKFDLTVAAFVYAGFFWALVVLTVIDLEHKLLPDRIVFPLFVVGWVGLTVDALVRGEPGDLTQAAIGAAIFGGFFYLLAVLVPAGMGGGDLKLAFVLGTFLGYSGGVGTVLVGMFLSFLSGGLIGVLLIAFSKAGRKTQIPFGPYLALGTTIAVFAGESLSDLYVGMI
jgi:leader peptidase (prepilin peptidase) / N-methyltransferase